MLLKTKDTDVIIDDSFKGKTLFLIDDKGNKWKQTDYKCDLVFDGKSFFTLLAEMNNLTCACNSEMCKLIGGSDMFFNDDLKNEFCFPNIVENECWVWKK